MTRKLNQLSVKIIIPIAAIMLLTGVPLYVLIHNTVTDFARQSIKKDLEDLSRYTFDIVDRGFMDLVKEGKTDDRISTRLKQVDSLDAIELFMRDQHFFVIISSGRENHILLDSGLNMPEKILDTADKNSGIQQHRFNETTFFSQQTYFSPWEWKITVLKDASKYAALSHKITFFSRIAGAIWLLGTICLIYYLLRTVQAPVNNIIKAVSKGTQPKYHGTHEFEFLSDSIAKMMQSLQEAKQKAEENGRQLQVSNEEVKALLNNSPVGIVYIGLNRKIEQVNQEVIRQTGYAEEELIGHPTRMLFPDRQHYETFGKKVYPTLLENGTCSINQQLKHKNGTLVWCHLHGRFFRQNDGKEGVIWLLEDLTERMKTEEELLKIKKLEAVGVLAGGLAHDFNNLLTAVLGNLSLAANKLPPDSSILPLIKKSEKAAIRAGDLTRKLLTFSKGDAPIKEASSLPELIQESADFVLHGSGVQCQYNIPEDLWQADIDRSQISQVIQNLALNARQAMNDSGTLTISCRNRTKEELPEEAHTLPPDNYVVITIHDNGPGIPEDIIDRIFDPYFSTKELDKTKGSGLGLAIVHSIIEKHNGLITIESSHEQGSMFTLYLPAARKGEKSIIKETAHKTAATGLKTIMVMDDEAMIRAVAQEMLQHFGYQVIPVQDGREAIATYHQLTTTGHPVDAVIMDLTIPGGLGGKEAIDELLALDPNAKVIVTSGYADDPIMANYSQYGFTAAISKPFTLNGLETVLHSLFS